MKRKAHAVAIGKRMPFGRNLQYTDRNKFTFGAVMQVNGLNYYVSVSSFDKKQEANILIRVSGDEKEVKGSLRFNYMVPVPDECIEKIGN